MYSTYVGQYELNIPLTQMILEQNKTNNWMANDTVTYHMVIAQP